MNDVKLLVLDVDGTLTDGKIYIGAAGELMKAFDIKDGYGIHDILPTLDIVPVIITGRKSDILSQRCMELGIIHCYQGIHDKLSKLNLVLEELSSDDVHYSLANAAYCGDDCNDLPCMLAIKAAGGIIGCPNDAVEEVRSVADFVSNRNGGNGAVRSFIEWLKKRSND